MSKEIKEVKEEVKVGKVSREEFDNLAAKVRKMAQNWKSFAVSHLGEQAVDGKLKEGRANIWALVAVFVVGLGLLAFAENFVKYATGDYWDESGNIVNSGTITSSGAMSAASISSSGLINSTSTADGLGTKNVAKASYSYATDGGVTGAVTSLGVTIPDNAVIIGGYIDVTTGTLPLTSTFAIQLNTANDIYSASTNLQDVGISAIVPVYTAATAVKATNDLAVSVLMNTTTVTQGEFTVVLEYDIMPN